MSTPDLNPDPGSPMVIEPVSLRGVGRRFGGQEVLRNLTLSVRSGETLVVIGESGCGKSVTLKLMISLLDATSGEVHWEGHHVAGLSRAERDRHRLRFGYLFQNSALFDSFDVFENVAYGLRESGGRSEADIRAVVVERLEEVGLEAEICSKKPAARGSPTVTSRSAARRPICRLAGCRSAKHFSKTCCL